MKIKSHSLLFGYKVFTAQIGQDKSGNPVLVAEDYGPIPPLDFIKQGFKILEAAPHEIAKLKNLGYPPS